MDISQKIRRDADLIRERILEEIEKQIDPSDLLGDSTVINQSIPPESKIADYLEASRGWIYACVGAIADEIASIDLKLFRLKKGNVDEVDDHPVIDLLHRANNFTTKFDLFWLTTNYLELSGEAPWFLIKEGGVPSQILLLRPDRLKVIPGSGVEIVSGYKYRTGPSKEVSIERDEMVFLRYPDPAKPFRGVGTLKAVAKTVDIDDFSETWNRNFFSNAAVPSMVLETDQKLGKDQVERLEKKLKKYKTVDNAHKTMILQKGLKYKPMTVSQRDMDFVKQMQFSRDKMLAIFRVPKHILGMVEDVNRANAEASDVVFAKRTIRPKMQRIVEQLNEFLLPLYGDSDDLFIDYVDPVPENEELKIKQHESALNHGYMTLNEIRQIRGLDDVGPKGDVLRIPNNLVDIDTEGEEEKPEEGRSIFIKQLNARTRKIQKRKAITQRVKHILEDKLTKKIEMIMESQIGGKRAKKKREKDEDDPQKLGFQAKQLRIGERFEPLFIKKVNKIFKDQRDTLIDMLPEGKSARRIKQINPNDFQFDPQKEGEKYAKAVEDFVENIIKAQSVEAFNFLGVDNILDLDNPIVREYLESTTFRFGREVTKTTNKKVGKLLSNSIKKGESIQIIRKKLQRLFIQFSKARAERIARSEVIRATNFATEQSYIKSGVVSHKEWLTALDERVCQWCLPMNRRVIPLEHKYFDYNDSFQGTQGGILKFNYTSIQYPPLHPSCRCTLIPIISKSAAVHQIKKLQQDIFDMKEEKEKKKKEDEKITKLLDGNRS